MEISKKQTAICGVCPGGCAVEVTVDKGKLIDLVSLKGAPYGSLCVRGKHAPEVVYSPDRLSKPLIRTGERGKGEFRAATWDEALNFVAERMKSIRAKDGPQALASHSGRGGFEQSVVDFTGGGDTVTTKLLWPFGSPNVASVSSVCYTSFGILAPMTTLGLPGTRLEPDLENSSLIVVWGANPAT
ncbi:MAG: molybdopterin-dependent oxidoreductase, partial [Desulfosporosinus sp.]